MMLIVSQMVVQATPLPNDEIGSSCARDEVQLERRAPPPKKSVTIKELLKPENQNLRVQVHPEKKKNTSMVHKMSDTIKNKPFLAFATILSGSILANTAVVAACIKYKEDKVMHMKEQKGELPVHLVVPAKSPDAVIISPTEQAKVQAPLEPLKEQVVKLKSDDK